MFLIRQSQPEDVSTLSRMAKMVYFINLPPNEQIILSKIEHSNRCFARLAAGVTGTAAKGSAKAAQKLAQERRGVSGLAAMEQDSDFFMFSMEDVGGGEDGEQRTTKGASTGDRLVGTSQVRAHQGGPGNPNWAFKITEKKHYSASLKFGTTHAVGQLYGDESGPTEIGGLIIAPSYRGHAERPGRLLSFVRFHFIGVHRHMFADRILAEMMAPVTAEGDNILWDAFGRKFIPVKFAEADRFCQHNRSFIPELLPEEEIYLSLFPLEVQNALGVVSRETIPARRLLESMGFAYRGFIDPFDGGPHLDAPTDSVPLVKQTRMLTVGKAAKIDQCTTGAIVSYLNPERLASGGGFRATQCRVLLDAASGTARLPSMVMSLLGVKVGGKVACTPTDALMKPADAFASEPKSASGRTDERKGVKVSGRAAAKNEKSRKGTKTLVGKKTKTSTTRASGRAAPSSRGSRT